jgi:hypothetical protein
MCDDITLSLLLFIHHSSKIIKRHNTTNKERENNKQFTLHQKIVLSELGIGSKEGNNSYNDTCTSRREDKRDQMAANKIA